MTIDEIKERFGFDPKTIGLRYRSHYVIETPDDDDRIMGAEAGWLVVSARDGASNDRDDDVDGIPNFEGDFENPYDSTYRCYYFKPLEAQGQAVGNG